MYGRAGLCSEIEALIVHTSSIPAKDSDDSVKLNPRIPSRRSTSAEIARVHRATAVVGKQSGASKLPVSIVPPPPSRASILARADYNHGGPSPIYLLRTCLYER